MFQMRDTCDKKGCGAPAFVFIVYATGHLAFCQHHGNEVVSASFMNHGDNVVIIREPVPA